jgi:DNA polymerase (family 10)
MTNRICKAIENLHLTILGHPTGRLLLAREGYALNMEKVIDTAAKFSKAIELNSNPHRLDIDWRYGPYVKKKKVKIAICPDAHSIEGMRDVMFGVGIARKSWYTKDDVVNAWPLEKFLKWVGNKR